MQECTEMVRNREVATSESESNSTSTQNGDKQSPQSETANQNKMAWTYEKGKTKESPALIYLKQKMRKSQLQAERQTKSMGLEKQRIENNSIPSES